MDQVEWNYMNKTDNGTYLQIRDIIMKRLRERNKDNYNIKN